MSPAQPPTVTPCSMGFINFEEQTHPRRAQHLSGCLVARHRGLLQMGASSTDQLCINTIRTLAMDAVQKANSGHPGTPMALAPVGYTVWNQFLRYHPKHPDWPNRDRFVLSVGHASMLLYSLLHLAGVVEIDAQGKRSGQPAISLDDIKQFRQ